MFKETLQQIGLTEGEAKVYESLLSLGPSTVGPIVKKSGVAYSNVYEILNRLIEKGIVSFVIREKTKHFQAVEPNRLQEYLEKQEAKIQQGKTLLTQILPSLLQLKTFAGKKQEAEIFVGTKGIMTAYEILLSNPGKNKRACFLSISDPSYHELMYEFYTKAHKLYKKLGIKWDGIYGEEVRKTKMVTESSWIIRSRFVSFPLPANVDIYRDKVFIIAWADKPTGILIHSEEIAGFFQRYFDAVWKMAKP